MNLKAIPLMLSMIPSVLRGPRVHDLEKIKAIARKAYPSVEQISLDTLDGWMHKPEQSFLLVDVRSPEEFAVSHLRGAVNLRTPEEIATAVQEQKPSRTVLYCSVGFRSSRLAHVLTARGIANMMNLEGAIFQWANEGRAVFQGEVPVRQVHPFSKRWAGLLRKGVADGISRDKPGAHPMA